MARLLEPGIQALFVSQGIQNEIERVTDAIADEAIKNADRIIHRGLPGGSLIVKSVRVTPEGPVGSISLDRGESGKLSEYLEEKEEREGVIFRAAIETVRSV